MTCTTNVRYIVEVWGRGKRRGVQNGTHLELVSKLSACLFWVTLYFLSDSLNGGDLFVRKMCIAWIVFGCWCFWPIVGKGQADRWQSWVASSFWRRHPLHFWGISLPSSSELRRVLTLLQVPPTAWWFVALGGLEALDLWWRNNPETIAPDHTTLQCSYHSFFRSS